MIEKIDDEFFMAKYLNYEIPCTELVLKNEIRNCKEKKLFFRLRNVAKQYNIRTNSLMIKKDFVEML